MAWILTKGLQNLRAQVDAAFPDRDKRSDGTVGDLAHQTGMSGHNPDKTGKAEYKDGDSLDEVRAWDMDSDLRAAPATAQQVVDHIRKLPGVSSVLRYMIYNRKIYRASNGWKAEPYDGPSPHTEHIHFSGAYSQAADNNTSFDYRLEEIPVALTDADKKWLADQLAPLKSTDAGVNPLAKIEIPDYAQPEKSRRKLALSTWIGYTDSNRNTDRAAIIAAIKNASADVDEQALAQALAPLLADEVAARLPADRDDVTPAELQDAIVGALRILVDRPTR